jgi:hypothetical protein
LRRTKIKEGSANFNMQFCIGGHRLPGSEDLFRESTRRAAEAEKTSLVAEKDKKRPPASKRSEVWGGNAQGGHYGNGQIIVAARAI